jgi:hypothetical protein
MIPTARTRAGFSRLCFSNLPKRGSYGYCVNSFLI